MPMFKRGCFFLLLILGAACNGGSTTPSTPQAGDVYCTSLIPNAFFCPTSQANLQGNGDGAFTLPNGLLGYCIDSVLSTSAVAGYSATLVNGGAYLVDSLSNAQNECNAANVPPTIGGGCTSIITCSRP
jgi:hypothetical protein